MKRIFPFIVTAFLVLTAQARPADHRNSQARLINQIEQMAAKSDYHFKMSAYYSTDAIEHITFGYDDHLRLVAVNVDMPFEPSMGYCPYIDSVFYNEQGQLSKVVCWQIMDTGSFIANYVEYTYDADGNLSSRTNYNRGSSHYELGGIYHYFYNDNHQIVKSELTMMNTLYQRVLYNYDSNNRLAEELWYDYDYYLGLILDYKVAYQYGNDGKLLCEIDSVYDYDFWYFAGQRSYTYSDGNMVQYSSYDDYMFEVERRVYSYDPLQTAAETILPWHPEIDRPFRYDNTNVYTFEEQWVLDAEYTLQHYCDYVYLYDEATQGIASVDANPIKAYPSPATEWLRIDGLPQAPQQVEVLDLMGRVAISQPLSATHNKLNVSSLHPGLYLLKTPQGVSRFVVK